MEKRLQTVLSHAGISSRRHAEEIIAEGNVKVNGRVVTEKGIKVDPDKDIILVYDRPIPAEEKKYYFLLNKPEGFISTVQDTHGRRKITDLFKHISARLYPIGRLDKDTTGLIIITNDGSLTQKLSHPSFEIEKEYNVTVEGSLKTRELKKLEEGVEVEGKITSPCKVSIIGPYGKAGMVYRVILHEGRKRQIKQMFEAVGYKVTGLERTKYAGLTIKGVKRGESRPLKKEEIERLKKLVS